MFVANILFGICLLVLSVLLMTHHLRTRGQGDIEDEVDAEFFRRQYHRRMWTSSLIGAVGLGMLAGNLIGHPVVLLIHWGIVLLLLVAIGVLGAIDWVAIRRYYRALIQRHDKEHNALRAELKRLRSIEGNGKHD